MQFIGGVCVERVDRHRMRAGRACLGDERAGAAGAVEDALPAQLLQGDVEHLPVVAGEAAEELHGVELERGGCHARIVPAGGGRMFGESMDCGAVRLRCADGRERPPSPGRGRRVGDCSPVHRDGARRVHRVHRAGVRPGGPGRARSRLRRRPRARGEQHAAPVGVRARRHAPRHRGKRQRSARDRERPRRGGRALHAGGHRRLAVHVLVRMPVVRPRHRLRDRRRRARRGCLRAAPRRSRHPLPERDDELARRDRGRCTGACEDRRREGARQARGRPRARPARRTGARLLRARHRDRPRVLRA